MKFKISRHKLISIVKIALLACLIFVITKNGKKDDALTRTTVKCFPVHNMEKGYVKVDVVVGECTEADDWKNTQNNFHVNDYEVDNGCIKIARTNKCNAASVELNGNAIPVYTEEDYEKYRFVTSVGLNLQSIKFGKLVAALLKQWESHFCLVVKGSNDTYYAEFHPEFDHIFHNNWRKLSALKNYGEDADAIRLEIRKVLSHYFQCLGWDHPDEYNSWKVRFLYEPEMYDSLNLKTKKDSLDWKDNKFPRSKAKIHTQFQNGKFTFEFSIVNLAYRKRPSTIK